MVHVYLVDWDIPRGVRRKFYYELAKIKRAHGLHGSMSSQSVMLIDDGSVAREVYELANRYGQANLYRVEKVASFRSSFS